MVPHHGSVRIADFALERYFARWEFAAEHLLCASDVQAYPMAELLALADDETRALWDGLELGYTESTGHPLLRREIAALYETIEPDDVLTFAGAEEAIFCLANVLLGPGDHAIVTWPAYQSLYEVGRAAGADVTLHELHESDGWAIDIDRLRAQVTPATRLIVVNTPHNPTGMLADRADLRRARRDRRRSPARISSSTRSIGASSSTSPSACRPAPTRSERGISLGVMSKAYAMAGLRIGWLATHDRDLLARLAGVQGLHDDLLVRALGDPVDHRAPCQDRRSWPARAGSSPPTSSCSTPSSTTGPIGSPGSGPAPGSIGFARLTVPGVRIDDWAAELVQAEGVLLAPGLACSSTRATTSGSASAGPTCPRRSAASRRSPKGRSDDPPRSPQHRHPRRRRPGSRRSRSTRRSAGSASRPRSMARSSWFGTADSTIGLFPWDELAHDANLPPEPRAPFGGITLAINVESPEAVTAGLDAAVAAGGTLLKPATLADWGGTSGYFADPDGHPWEVAHNPGFPIDEDGRVRIP